MTWAVGARAKALRAAALSPLMQPPMLFTIVLSGLHSCSKTNYKSKIKLFIVKRPHICNKPKIKELYKSCETLAADQAGGGSGVYILGGQWGGHNCSWGGGTYLYCHSEPPLTNGKLCFIIKFIGGPTGVE